MMNNISQEIRKLNRKVLSQIETEFNVLKDDYPEAISDMDNAYKRIRKNVLDIIGDCERTVVEMEDDG